jgi:hypothetical protein
MDRDEKGQINVTGNPGTQGQPLMFLSMWLLARVDTQNPVATKRNERMGIGVIHS